MTRQVQPLRGLLCLVVLVLGTGLISCGDDPADPTSPEQLLLEKAVKAVWGETDPDSVQSLRQRSRYETVASSAAVPAPVSQVEILAAGPKRYRKQRLAPFGIVEVFAMDGDEVWATIDGTLVPLTEEEATRRRLQPWLVQISKIAPLRDTKLFDLDHKGIVELDNGSRVEELRVIPKEYDGLELVFDFDPDSHLPQRVVMMNKRSREELAIELSDYRSINGVQVAHRVLGFRNGKQVSTEIIESIELDVDLGAAPFKKPEHTGRDLVVEKSASLSGPLAYCVHEGDADDAKEIFDTVAKLREWIEERGFIIVGPLVVMRNRPQPAGTSPELRTLVGIAVGALAKDPIIEAGSAFGWMSLEAQPALCLTHVGEASSEDLIAKLATAAAERGSSRSGPPLEIIFSADGKTRQIQLPIRKL
ncbi:MAG: hypothetical protein V3W41_06340 [Planctomycetota bacterium]